MAAGGGDVTGLQQQLAYLPVEVRAGAEHLGMRLAVVPQHGVRGERQPIRVGAELCGCATADSFGRCIRRRLHDYRHLRWRRYQWCYRP